MSEVGSTFVTVVPSARGFGKTLDKQVGGDVQTSGKTIGKRFGTALKVGALAVAGGAAVAAKFLGDSIGKASDLAENQSKVGVVFGKSAGQIMAASKTSTRAMGLSQNAYLEASGTLGNLLVSLDIAPKKAAGMSQQMVKLAGDLASFNNVSPEEALEALKSGLTGETEPLKRFGVNMNDATLKAQALKMGLIENTKDALTPQTKALAAQALIMKQTGTAQGDFARTSDGLANQQRILAASVDDVQAKIGEAFLPVATKAVALINDKVVPAVSKFVGEMQDGTGAGGEFVDTLKDIWTTGSNVVGFFTSLPGPVKKYGTALVIATVAMSKLRTMTGPMVSSLSSLKTGLANTETRAKTMGTAMDKARVGAANLAGAAGLGLLVAGMGQTNRATGTLMTTLGGAAVGFSVGGPIGAAIGGLAGAASGLGSSIKAAGDKAVGTLGQWKDYAETLDQVSGATTRATREMATAKVTQSGALSVAKSYGYSQKQVVDAITDGGPIRDRLVQSLKAEKSGYQETYDALVRKNGGDHQAASAMMASTTQRRRTIDAFLTELGVVPKATAATLENAKANRTYSAAIKSLPKEVRTEIKTEGLGTTRKDIVDLTRRFHLVPKDVRTLIEENGGKPTKKMVDGIIASAKLLDRQKPKPTIGATDMATALIKDVKNRLDALPRDKYVTIHVNRVGSAAFDAGLGLAGGRRASGGPISAGETYLVGERGPELFTSRQAGRIISNNRLTAAAATGAGGSGALVNIEQMITHDPAEAAYRLRVEQGRALTLAGLP